MKKLTINNAECTFYMDVYVRGSVLRGDIEAGATGCRCHLTIDSPESQDDLEDVIRLAKRGCYAEQILARATPIHSTYEVNGNSVHYDI